jgi:hypothetical protein
VTVAARAIPAVHAQRVLAPGAGVWAVMCRVSGCREFVPGCLFASWRMPDAGKGIARGGRYLRVTDSAVKASPSTRSVHVDIMDVYRSGIGALGHWGIGALGHWGHWEQRVVAWALRRQPS